MRSTSYSDLRKNLAARLDEVAADRAPLLVTVYYTGSTISDETRNEVIAEAGRIVATSLK